MIGAGRHKCSASRVRVRINSSDKARQQRWSGKVAVLACRMGGERRGLGGGPPLRCSRASLRERNGHLTSPASFHTAGRIEGRALSLFSRKENERKDKTQSAVDQPKTHKTSIYKTKNKQVVTHLTSRHAERNKKRGSFGARILVPPLGGNTKQRSSVPISICASQPGGGRGLAFGWVLLFFSSLWVFGFSPENNIFLRRGGQVHCGRAAKQTALLRSVGGGTKQSASAIGAGANSTTRNELSGLCARCGVCFCKTNTILQGGQRNKGGRS